MRAAAVIVLGVLGLAACGGSPPPPADAPSGDTSADTSSLETSSGASKEKPAEDMPAAAASPAPAPKPAPAAAAPESPAAVAFHPAPSATGTIDGKAFSPKVAQLVSPMAKDGRVTLVITEASECGADKGDAQLTLTVPWSDGYKVDVSALKLPGKKGPAEIAFSRNKKNSTTFKPSGTVTVVKAPTEKGATGKLKLDVQSGDFMLAGTVDIEVCVAPQ